MKVTDRQSQFRLRMEARIVFRKYAPVGRLQLFSSVQVAESSYRSDEEEQIITNNSNHSKRDQTSSKGSE